MASVHKATVHMYTGQIHTQVGNKANRQADMHKQGYCTPEQNAPAKMIRLSESIWLNIHVV